MRLSTITTAIVLLAAGTIGSASAAESSMPSGCSMTCAACIRATPHTNDQSTMHADQPWYIGPKGGDTRKGHTLVASEFQHPATRADIVTPGVAAVVDTRFIGPKGGDTRKGHAMSASEIATAPTFKPETYCASYYNDNQGLKRGPKGGFFTTKGQSDMVLNMRADQACLAACSR